MRYARVVSVAIGSAAALVALVACSPASTPASSPSATISAAGAAAPAASSPTPTASAPAIPASCGGLSLDEGAQLASAKLAACLEDFEIAARTGHSDIELVAGEPTSSIDWMHADDGTYAVLTGDATTVAITPTQGWEKTESGWVEGKSDGSSAEMFAQSLVETLRQETDARFEPALIGMASGYTVQGREETELANGDTASLWKITSDSPVQITPELPGADVTIYTDTLGPTVKIVTSSSGASSVRYYSKWGDSVDLSIVDDLTHDQ